jgi:hypothetical protein
VLCHHLRLKAFPENSDILLGALTVLLQLASIGTGGGGCRGENGKALSEYVISR